MHNDFASVFVSHFKSWRLVWRFSFCVFVSHSVPDFYKEPQLKGFYINDTPSRLDAITGHRSWIFCHQPSNKDNHSKNRKEAHIRWNETSLLSSKWLKAQGRFTTLAETSLRHCGFISFSFLCEAGAGMDYTFRQSESDGACLRQRVAVTAW